MSNNRSDLAEVSLSSMRSYYNRCSRIAPASSSGANRLSLDPPMKVKAACVYKEPDLPGCIPEMVLYCEKVIAQLDDLTA